MTMVTMVMMVTILTVIAMTWTTQQAMVEAATASLERKQSSKEQFGIESKSKYASLSS